MSLGDLLESRKTALTVPEVAELLSVSPRLIYQLVAIGEIPHFRVGKAVRFEPKSLSLWLRKKLERLNGCFQPFSSSVETVLRVMLEETVAEHAREKRSS